MNGVGFAAPAAFLGAGTVLAIVNRGVGSDETAASVATSRGGALPLGSPPVTDIGAFRNRP
ncbi:hypothetical protein GJ633_06835 [Halorubrum sp. CBA1125]|uniref:hypothetical protein n=1 Tax=Halorubrum sp. CBA1125 TaxID=2668072 RepID=UPI0012E80D83|nr:hypothetical protein [Halorubrum sp. CBA1125]MUW14412.1 hypothetical protein [Halorubrum sp. CBA1125]